MFKFFFKKSRIIITLLCACINLWAVAQKEAPGLRLKNGKQKTNYATDTTTVNRLDSIAEKLVYYQPDSALGFAKQALQIAKKLPRPTPSEARAAATIAKIYYVQGHYYPSLDASEETYAISKKINYKSGLASAYNVEGLIYLAEDKLTEALPEFQNAVQINERIKDSIKLAANYFDIGLTYDENHLYSNAFVNLAKAMDISRNTKNWHIVAMTFNRLGETYYHVKNYPTALQYYQRVLAFKLYRDNWEDSFAYSGIAQTYQAMGQYQKAIDYAQKSLGYSAKMKASWDAERGLGILADASAASGKYEDAYHYEGTLKAYADTLYNEAKEKDINYLHLKEKQEENLTLVKENQLTKQTSKLKNLIIFVISIIALFLVLLIFIIIRNIDQKNKLNTELKDKNTDIALQKEEILTQQKALIAINNTKDQLFSVISHDLRSPFAAIQMSLELIRNGDLDKNEYNQVLESFQQEVGLVSGMINNLLNWANSQQKGISTSFEKINLTETTDNILQVSMMMAYNKNQEIIHQKGNEPVWITADPNHVKIILHNLIGNAIKFTPEGGSIHIFYNDDGAYYAVHIKDTGIGIKPDKMKKLFKEIGKSISEQGTNKEPGTGIGLMLIKQFTEENGGHIEVKSEPGKGSEFIVYFKKAI